MLGLRGAGGAQGGPHARRARLPQDPRPLAGSDRRRRRNGGRSLHRPRHPWLCPLQIEGEAPALGRPPGLWLSPATRAGGLARVSPLWRESGAGGPDGRLKQDLCGDYRGRWRWRSTPSSWRRRRGVALRTTLGRAACSPPSPWASPSRWCSTSRPRSSHQEPARQRRSSRAVRRGQRHPLPAAQPGPLGGVHRPAGAGPLGVPIRSTPATSPSRWDWRTPGAGRGDQPRPERPNPRQRGVRRRRQALLTRRRRRRPYLGASPCWLSQEKVVSKKVVCDRLELIECPASGMITRVKDTPGDQ